MGIKRSVDFPEELLERIKKVAESKGVTPSTIIKMACKEFVDREEKQSK